MTAARACRECGRVFEVERRPSREFCSASCRRAFNNRKMQRGAELYDLLMAWRYDRAAASAAGVLRLLCRAAAIFKAKDDRAGRRSWDELRRVVERKPYLNATLLTVDAAGVRRGRRRAGAGSSPLATAGSSAQRLSQRSRLDARLPKPLRGDPAGGAS